jgi:serine protease Do
VSCAAPSPGDAIYRSALHWVAQFVTDEQGGTGIGSGFVVAPGWVATNEHVVRGASRIVVRFADGQTHPGTTGWADATEDLALVRVADLSDSNVYPAPMAGWSTLAPGKDVYVLGAPLGLDWSFSRGVVSALRPASVDGLPHIQIDAAVNPGNSGGPLIDACGRVVGVIRMKLLSPGGGEAENLNFARPVDSLVQGMRKVGLSP